MRRPALRGLRARLVAAFLIVSAVSGLATAAFTFSEGRKTILQQTQQLAVQDLGTRVQAQAWALPVRPGRMELEEFVDLLDPAGGPWHWRTAAAYGGSAVVTARKPGGVHVASEALREEARTRGTTVAQRVEREGELWLVIGMPVLRDVGDASAELVVTAELPLAREEHAIADLVTAAQSGALPAAALAFLLALIAAGGVLRPVRQLRNATEKIADGNLGTRLPDTGRDELGDLTRTFNTMAAALERDREQLREHEAKARRFAADVSHELRTPLAAMTAVTDVLDTEADLGTLSPDATDTLRLISDETRKLARLIDGLMEISRFDAGAAALHLDDIDIAQAVSHTLHLRGWQEQVAVGLPEDLRVRLDPRRLDIVLANLVGNALRHGGPPVSLLAHTDGYHLLIEVADQGPGIAPQALPHIFDRFYKADAARPRSPGSGLGLAIAAENVRLHGGTLTAANAPDGGAVFTVSLPLTPPTTKEDNP